MEPQAQKPCDRTSFTCLQNSKKSCVIDVGRVGVGTGNSGETQIGGKRVSQAASQATVWTLGFYCE